VAGGLAAFTGSGCPAATRAPRDLRVPLNEHPAPHRMAGIRAFRGTRHLRI